MDKYNNPMARGTCYLLIYLTGVYPLNSAFAGGITPDNSQTQVQNNGNVPVVNIAAPNNAGISHNTYKEFNTDIQGAVLNNATQAVNSQLAGQINANTNLQGEAAQLIINEVTGSSRSELLGQLEVAGQKANVMIANPNGITCDGCGFINTSGAVLTTGKTQFDTQGALEALNVTKGQITIGGKGLNGQSTDYVDIISRATELNGKIQANNLALTQGANQISFKDGTTKTIAGEGAAPQLAVDTKALGGMYANKIRLIATENGVGVNLKDITSNQGDITLSANGKMELGSIKAKTDLNADAKEINIGPNSPVQAERNIILASSKLSNKSNVTAGQDMRIYANELHNISADALFQADNNMWIQKNTEGDKSKYIENNSAAIKTNKGDLIIRTEKLDNIQESSLNNDMKVEATSTSKNNRLGITEYHDIESIEGYSGEKKSANIKKFEYSKWFDTIDFYQNNAVNVKRYLTQHNVNFTKASISSGNNLYINATNLDNINSDIKSKKDLIPTGRDLNVISTQNGEKNIFHTFDYAFPCFNFWGGCDTDHSFFNLGEAHSWKDINPQVNSLLFSEGNLIADFSNNINIEKKRPYYTEKTGEITIDNDNSESLVSMKNIVLSSNSINNKSNIRSSGDISIIANDFININQSKVLANKGLSINAVNDIEIIQSDLKGKDISLLSKEGDANILTDNRIGYFLLNGIRWLGGIEATNDLTISAGNNAKLSNLRFKPQSGNISIIANQGITVNYDDSILKNNKRMSELFNRDKELKAFEEALSIEKLNTKGSVYLNSVNQSLNLRGIGIEAGKDINLISAKDIDLGPRIISKDFGYRYWIGSQGVRWTEDKDTLWMYNSPNFSLVDDTYKGGHKNTSAEITSAIDPFEFWISTELIDKISSKVKAGGDLLVQSGRDLSGQSATLSSNGHTLLFSGRNITFNSFPYSTAPNPIGYDWEQRGYQLDSSLIGQKKLTLISNNTLTTQGGYLQSKGDINITSDGNIRFESSRNGIHKITRDSSLTNITHKSTEINSVGNLNIVTNGSLLFQATKLNSWDKLNVAAKGGYLYAQAQEEVLHETNTSSKTSWGGFGNTKTSTQNRHDVTNKVTEFKSIGDINLLSRGDSTYEASKFEAGKNATLTRVC